MLTKYLAMLTVAALSLAVQAVSVPAELDLIKKAYSGAKTASFHVEFEATDPSGQTAKGGCDVDFMAPNKLRAEMSGTQVGRITLICNGSQISVISANGRKREYRYSTETLSRNLPTNLETICFFDAAHELSTEHGGGMSESELGIVLNVNWNEKNWTVLRETNKKEDLTVDYFLDPQTHIIWRTLGKEISTSKSFIDSRMTKLVLNQKIDPKRFEL